ncbi:hypothetical protein ACSNOH_01560 [Streptomyces sp. URMC 127]|uniref:hypothetical protein n=1 Tax=Streptomyces sp. URMC 127 TaxID=3423402 RepID=UPI003F1B17D7
MTNATSDQERAAQLRDKVVDELVERGEIVSKKAAAVMRKVERHKFAPEASLEDAYHTYNAVITKRNEHGKAVSSVSAPQIQAFMLEQAEISPGMRVLEIGSGGLNAAYLADLVGDAGEVTTVDIDQEVIDRTTRLPAEAGYSRVRVVLADATGGVSAHAPYDVIMVTVGTWDIPSAWGRQLVMRIPEFYQTRSFSSDGRVPNDVGKSGSISMLEGPPTVRSAGPVDLEHQPLRAKATQTEPFFRRACQTPRLEFSWMGPVPRPPALKYGSLPGLRGGGFGPTGVQALLRATSAACQPGPISGTERLCIPRRSDEGHGVLRRGMTSGPAGMAGRASTGVASRATMVMGCWQWGQFRVAVGSSGSRWAAAGRGAPRVVLFATRASRFRVHEPREPSTRPSGSARPGRQGAAKARHDNAGPSTCE